MTQSLYSLLNNIIDYAGLFPPAQLSLDKAIHNFARYRKGSDHWMLSRFIVPAGMLKDLTIYSEELFTDTPPFDFSVTGSKGDTVSEFINNLKSDLENIQKFHEDNPGLVTTQIYETKLPIELIKGHDKKAIWQLLDEVMNQIENNSPNPVSVFYESAFDENYQMDNIIVMDALAEHQLKISKASKLNNYLMTGFKLRCGGVKAHMFPSSDQVVFAINHAIQGGLTMKATAGLHHPIRHFNQSVNTKMYGFFNLFIGAILSRTHGLNDEQLKSIIEEEDVNNFTFENECIRWKDYEADIEQIDNARREFIVSYGSCSFDEPRDDLREFGLMP
ncbi:MAG TPA: hypothetical protein VJ991_03830 [Balneolales bacterium]|nr:hypothetical protein [Balneolales bacterium]